MENHKILGLAASGIFAVLLLWRAMNRTHYPKKPLFLVFYFIVAISGVSVMFYGAHLGGVMVYEHGVGSTAAKVREGGGHEHVHGEEHMHEGGQSPSGESPRDGEAHIHKDGSLHER
jgi:hypothetical protein